MLLFAGMRILASKQLAHQFCDYANELLVKFVKDTETLYGKEAMVYNVHSLVHLAADVKRLGCLDEFSAFVFENKLGQLKKLVRKPQQVLRRLDERMLFGAGPKKLILEPVTKYEHSNGPMLPSIRGATQYNRLVTDEFSLSVTTRNNCIIVKGGVPALVKNIVKSRDNVVSLVCTQFQVVSDAFQYPLPSSRLSICKVQSELSCHFLVALEDVVNKCVCWPVMSSDDSFIVVPLLH